MALVMIAAFFGTMMVLTTAPQQVTVPRTLIGQQRERAIEMLRQLGLKAEIVEEYSGKPVGVVVRSDPRPGTDIRVNKSVALIVSKGPEPITVPTVVDKSLATARKEIAALGLKVGEEKREFSDIIDMGRVVSQAPGGDAKVPKGTPVDLVISKGPQEEPDPQPVDVQPQDPDEPIRMTSA